MAVPSPSLAAELAPHFLETRSEPTESSAGLTSQMQHRLTIVNFWAIAPGSRVLTHSPLKLIKQEIIPRARWFLGGAAETG